MLKCMVLEDEPLVRKELVLLTPWQSLSLLCAGDAGDGLAGLELADRIVPDIVITDIRMPGMDGLAFIEECSARRARAGIPVPEYIILSGFSEFEYARSAIRLGVGEYLLKPVDEEELADALRRSAARYTQRKASQSPERVYFAEYGNLGSAAGTGRDGYVEGAVRLIAERFIGGITIEEAAERLGVSAGHLSRLFRKETGYTFGDYLMNVRVKRAMELLRDPVIRVYEVADLVGYADSRYFAQVFRKVTGMNPREYRDSIIRVNPSSAPE